MTTKLKNELVETRRLTDALLDELLPLPTDKTARVVEAARYAALGGGKALRPFLLLTVGRLLGAPESALRRMAAALEMVHTYSLIHDDLPAMDNDICRRGKPTVHIQFDEATAILAGDALLTRAFEVLADEQTHPDAGVRCRLITTLAQAAGSAGMIGGQTLDLQGETTPLTPNEVTRMMALKTGCLLRYACLAPTFIVQTDKGTVDALTAYADKIGLLFQLTDDLLDKEGDAALVGKTLRKDEAAGKTTFIAQSGVQKTRETAERFMIEAQDALHPFGAAADLLRDTARLILERKK